MNKPFKMKGHSLPGINQRIDANPTNVAAEGLAGSSALQAKIPTGKTDISGRPISTMEDDPNYQVGKHTTYKHPTYYSEDGSIVKGGSTGDFDEGELSEVKKDKSGRKYVEKSTDIGGGRLYLDK